MPFFTQPYHRLKKNGVSSLSDAELLAIIISSGSRGESAVDTANRILKKYNFNKLSELNLTELKKELGNEVKALRILSLFELNKRKNKLSRGGFVKTIEKSKDIYNIFYDELKDKKKEHLYILMLDSRNSIINHKLISVGTVNQSLIHPREIFLEAVKESAYAIILVHNHPFGDSKPSQEDKLITEKIKNAGELMDVKLIDHVIISKEGYYSFNENGLI